MRKVSLLCKSLEHLSQKDLLCGDAGHLAVAMAVECALEGVHWLQAHLERPDGN